MLICDSIARVGMDDSLYESLRQEIFLLTLALQGHTVEGPVGGETAEPTASYLHHLATLLNIGRRDGCDVAVSGFLGAHGSDFFILATSVDCHALQFSEVGMNIDIVDVLDGRFEL